MWEDPLLARPRRRGGGVVIFIVVALVLGLLVVVSVPLGPETPHAGTVTRLAQTGRNQLVTVRLASGKVVMVGVRRDLTCRIGDRALVWRAPTLSGGKARLDDGSCRR